MDFFEAQARAKKRTSRLLVLFGVAVAGTIVAAYVAAVLLLHYAGANEDQRAIYGDYDPRGSAVLLWQPGLFGLVSVGTLVVVGLASLFKWREYSAGGSAVAESVGGRRIESNTIELHERRLLNVVEEMAIASGTPVPAVYVMDQEPAINAFAAGLTTSDAVVAVTRGTLEKLNRDELQGVVGHEFSHILNGDMRMNLRIASAIFGILVLGLAGRGILWSLRYSRTRSRDKDGNGLLIAIVAAGVALLIIGYVGYFFGRLIQAAVSRQREFLADASAVQFTRNPQGLTGALRKIGGYALGSNLESNKSAAIGHFFFAQAFRSGFTGLWATHPPLDERIRAIDPNFDGKHFEPPEVVDVAHESFVSAGLAPAPARRANAVPPPIADRPVARLDPAAARAAVQAIGSLTSEQLANAHDLLEATPDRLRVAAQTPGEARVLVFGLLLSDDPAIRSRQRNLVATQSGAEALRQLEGLEPDLQRARPEQKLPLLQIALPALRQIPAATLESFLGTLDELVHADAQVSTFEFALQKLLTHTLALGQTPTKAIIQYHSFQAVADEIGVVLSSLAQSATANAASAENAFATGAAELKLIESRLRFTPESGTQLARLDAALDKLAAASPVIKQRTLAAAAQVVTADGQLLITEAELLRAIAAALDCPMPPLTLAAA
ncbi:M48 family metalloprotease [Horticoccus sp. 23ND18S-11]|uniref:M48 family metalloprotease n=1 Tax=Horticoccus sp. 23ND18S-11 TaxID=3391832 RepID=UPI0039C944D3